MTQIGLLSAMIIAASPQPRHYPAATVLDAFGQVCGDTSSAKAVEASANKGGWEKFEPGANSQFGKLMAFGKASAAMMGVNGYQEATYRLLVAGRSLELAVTQVGDTTGCRVYDFAAGAPLDQRALQNWAKREPSARVDKPEMIISTTWEPGLVGNADKTQVAFFPVGSPLSTTMHLTGLALMAQSTGDTK